MAKTIRLDGPAPGADVPINTFLDARHYDRLFGRESVDVLKPDGSPLFVLRKCRLRPSVCDRVFRDLLRAARTTYNRGAVAGPVDPEDIALGVLPGPAVVDPSGLRYRLVKADGTVSRTKYAKPARSGVVGYMDRVRRAPSCRATAYTARDLQGWNRILPLVREVDAVFRQACPDRYEFHRAKADKTDPDFVVAGTVFTTCTVNHNLRTAAHRDKGDLAGGLGAMAVLRRGDVSGGYLVFPTYRVAVDVGHRDVLLSDVHEVHGNTAMDDGDRVSVVCYYRAGMADCGSAAEELARLKRLPPR